MLFNFLCARLVSCTLQVVTTVSRRPCEHCKFLNLVTLQTLYSKLPPLRTVVFAFVTEPWRLSSLSIGATPPPPKKKKALSQPYPYFLLNHLYWHLLFKGITGATTIYHIFSVSTHI